MLFSSSNRVFVQRGTNDCYKDTHFSSSLNMMMMMMMAMERQSEMLTLDLSRNSLLCRTAATVVYRGLIVRSGRTKNG